MFSELDANINWHKSVKRVNTKEGIDGDKLLVILTDQAVMYTCENSSSLYFI